MPAQFPELVYKLYQSPVTAADAGALATLVGAGWSTTPVYPAANVVLNAIVASQKPGEQLREHVITATGPITQYQLPETIILGTLDIFLSGLNLTIGIDYVFDGLALVTFTGLKTVNAGDVVKFRYRF